VADDGPGRIGVAWPSGGLLLPQRLDLPVVGSRVQGLELIGGDPATGTHPRPVSTSRLGTPIPSRWALDGEGLTPTTEVLGPAGRGWPPPGSRRCGPGSGAGMAAAASQPLPGPCSCPPPARSF
jgi:hypothetical protein